MVRVEIDSIRVSLMSQDRVVVLKDADSDRYLPIWIGAFEAEAIRVELSGTPVPRPLTSARINPLTSSDRQPAASLSLSSRTYSYASPIVLPGEEFCVCGCATFPLSAVA